MLFFFNNNWINYWKYNEFWRYPLATENNYNSLSIKNGGISNYNTFPNKYVVVNFLFCCLSIWQKIISGLTVQYELNLINSPFYRRHYDRSAPTFSDDRIYVQGLTSVLNILILKLLRLRLTKKKKKCKIILVIKEIN